MLATFLLCVTAVLAYLLGNLNGAIITSRLFYKKDVRNYGSGNAGLTNFYRTFGAAGVGMVIAVDVVKSILAISIGWALLAIVGEGTVGRIFAGFCLMLGHAFPVLYGFRGGKCALCGVDTAGLPVLSEEEKRALLTAATTATMRPMAGWVIKVSTTPHRAHFPPRKP